MGRYYFHLYNDEILHDEIGQEFADANAARGGAVRGIAELIAEHLAQGKPVDLSHRMEVADDSGAIVRTIVFSELFRYRGSPLAFA